MNTQPRDYLPAVKNQYEELPYPPRDPADEVRRLITPAGSCLYLASQMGWGGSKDFRTGNVRLLDAGGGTGDAAIFMAEQLRDNPDAEIVHLDMSAASQAICKQRAALRGLNNIRFVHASILDIPTLGLESFDYIVCSGVLHHLASPDDGLAALRGILRNDGCMYVMVYAQYGRTAIYQLQDALRLMHPADAPTNVKLAHAEAVLSHLPPTHWFRLRHSVLPYADATSGPSGLYDLLLHTQDRAYTYPQLLEWTARHGLQLTGEPGSGGNARNYDPATFLRDQALKDVQTLDIHQQRAIGELLHGQIIKHELWLSPKGDCAATWDDPSLIPDFLDPEGKTDMALWRAGAQRMAGRTMIIRLSEQQQVNISMSPTNTAFLGAVDGERSVAEIIATVAETLQQPEPALWEAWHAFCAVFARIQYMTFRKAGMPRWQTHGYIRQTLPVAA